jgi:hypothetical protein
MKRSLHNPLQGVALVVASAALIAGCASPQQRPVSEDPPAFSDPALSIPVAASSVVAGKSTRAELIATLGEGSVVRFDSGYEVRLYRDRRINAATSPAELVVLISPGGIAQKVRVKPATRLPSP